MIDQHQVASLPTDDRGLLDAAVSREPRPWVRTLATRPSAILGIVLLAVLGGLAALAPVVAPYGRQEQVGPPFGSPSLSHPLGLDDGGIDMVTLLMWGARVSLLVGFGATLLAAIVGAVVGIAAGYAGGRLDSLLMRVTDYFLIIPVVPLMIILAALWGATVFQIIVIIGMLLWTWIARVLRAEVKSLKERVYVKRVAGLGATHLRIIFRHILPQTVGLLVATTVPALGAAVFFEAALSFLGLGDPTRVSWGKLIQNAFERSAVSAGAWWAIVPPGVCIALLIVGCSLLGNSLGDMLDPRRGVSHLAARRSARAKPTRATSVSTSSEGSLLDVRDLRVSFDLPDGRTLNAVQGVSFALEKSERFGLVGESGCGKTTTMLALMGLLPPNATVSGDVFVGGERLPVTDEARIRAYRWTTIAMVFQGAMNALNPVKSVGFQIAEPLRVHGTHSRVDTRRRVAELLEMVGISRNQADRFPHEFSGGMRQRVVLAMALACRPKILLADEPTTALDVMVQAQILDLLRDLTDDLDLSLILVTHDLPVVSQMCSKAAVMYAGRIAEMGDIDSLYHSPRHPYTRLLYAATPHLHGSREVRSIPGEPPRLDRPYTGCPFQPRCDSAFGPCAGITPEFREVAAAQFAACHLNDPAMNVSV